MIWQDKRFCAGGPCLPTSQKSPRQMISTVLSFEFLCVCGSCSLGRCWLVESLSVLSLPPQALQPSHLVPESTLNPWLQVCINKVTSPLAALCENACPCGVCPNACQHSRKKRRFRNAVFGENMRVCNQKCAFRPTLGIVFQAQRFRRFCARHAVFGFVRVDDFSGFGSSNVGFVPRRPVFSVPTLTFMPSK